MKCEEFSFQSNVLNIVLMTVEHSCCVGSFSLAFQTKTKGKMMQKSIHSRSPNGRLCYMHVGL